MANAYRTGPRPLHQAPPPTDGRADQSPRSRVLRLARRGAQDLQTNPSSRLSLTGKLSHS